MGTSTSVAEFAAKLTQAGAAVQGATRASVAEAALAGKAIFLANMGTTSMSNVGRGAKLGARFDIKGTTNPTALLYYTGLVHLLNNPTSAHAIYPRGATVTGADGSVVRGRVLRETRRGTRGVNKGGFRGSGAKGLAFPDGNVRLYANHPGTSGKRFYERSVPQVAAAARRALSASTSTALRKVF